MLALVTGGGGRLGNVLVRHLLERRDRVRVLEPGDRPRSLQGLDVEVRTGSVLDALAVSAALEGASIVYHLAAKIDLRSQKDPMMHEVNVEGTRLVADACLESGVRMVHCSSHHALERRPLREPLTEDKPLALTERCRYHRSKAIAEALVLERCSRGLDAVIVNPGSMIGPYDFEPSMVGRALLDMYFGKIPVLLRMLSDYVDVRDVADGMISAAERGRPGERYLLTGEVVPVLEMARTFGEVSARKMPTTALPLWVGWAALPFALLGSAITNTEPFLTPDVLRASVSNAVVLNDKAKRELGFQVRPLRQSLGDSLAWYDQQGWLRG